MYPRNGLYLHHVNMFQTESESYLNINNQVTIKKGMPRCYIKSPTDVCIVSETG